VKLTTHFHLVSRSKMSGAIPTLPQYAFMARFSTLNSANDCGARSLRGRNMVQRYARLHSCFLREVFRKLSRDVQADIPALLRLRPADYVGWKLTSVRRLIRKLRRRGTVSFPSLFVNAMMLESRYNFTLPNGVRQTVIRCSSPSLTED
jgi:hypothetical protein